LRSQAEPGNEKADPGNESEAATDNGQRTTDKPRNLTEDLSRLRFTEIKLRSLRGSIGALLDAEDGVPAYLREIDLASGRFRSAAEILSADRLARLDAWPAVPNGLLVDEIRRWWQSQREGWSKNVHGFYNTLGRGITWPFRYAREKIQGEQTPPLEVYRRREWTAILETIEKAYDRLTMMTELGNPLLKDRLERVLGGKSRAALLEQLESEHARVDLQQELADQVVKEMRTFRDESPQFYTFLKRLDKVAAAVRPATSVVLFVIGFGPGGDAAAHVITDTAIQTVVHAAGDVAGGTVAAAVGDTAISGTAASGLGLVEAKFRRMHSAFAGRRVAWLLERLNEHLWGGLLEDLSAGAGVSASGAFREVESTLAVLGRQVEAA
jgi:hypothetical protein